MGNEQFASVEALLGAARPLPAPAERVRLREAAGLSRAQVATACGVGRQTVANWESGTDPQLSARGPYVRLLEGLAKMYPAPQTPAPAPAAGQAAEAAGPFMVPRTARGADGLAIRGEAAPCIRCGAMTPYKATDGRSLHVEAMCQADAGPPTAASEPAVPGSSPAAQAAAAAAERTQANRRIRSAGRAKAAKASLITAVVEEELEKVQGNMEEAIKALVKRAIPDAMAVLDQTRADARYKYTAYPVQPDILVKPKNKKNEPDQIWEARASWHHPEYSHLVPGDLAVTALDVNAAYLGAMKTWLPIGKLEHSTESVHHPKRSGVYLITPPEWRHRDLPNPLGARDEPGPLWVTDATLRLMLRLAGPKYRGLCEAPVIHESWTSGATENFLDDLRKLLTEARQDALDRDDDVTLQYVKSMYSKFVSTLGESIDNRQISRADWMHIIRAQSSALLWLKAYKAREAGLTVIAVKGTDELHVAGDWRSVFPEGRRVDQMKIKHGKAKALGEYTVGPVAR